MSVAPVAGQKWKWASLCLERKEEEAEEAAEEVEEGPGKGPSPKPPSSRKATEKSKRPGEESEEEGVIVTTFRRPLKMTEIHSCRKEFIQHLNETIVTWLLQFWDNGASSVSVDGSKARQLGNIARDSAIDRGISRCLNRAATLWERMLFAVKERHPLKDDLGPKMWESNTVEKGIQY